MNRLSENEISRWLSSRLAVYHVASRGNARDTDTNRVLFLDKKESALIARIKTPLFLYSFFGIREAKRRYGGLQTLRTYLQEVKIIEPEFAMSAVEYEAFEV